jgi:glycosyltransferase involved in cell wall biosynthesis
MKISKKKLWIVSELFHPEDTAVSYIFTEIAEKLINYRPVSVISGPLSYQKSNLVSSKKINSNIEIFRFNPLLDLDKNKAIQRALRMLIVSVQLTLKVIRLCKKGDEILLATNPATIIPLIVIIAKIKKIKLSILVHDVFPENLIPINIFKTTNPIYRILKFIFDYSYGKADTLIVLGRDMANIMIHKTEKAKTRPNIRIIENWSDIDEVKKEPFIENKYLSHIPNLSNKIIFQYAGNIGRLQGLEKLIEVVAKSKNENLHFLFLGEGALKSQLTKYVESNNVENVSFGASFSRDLQNTILNSCHIGIVSLYDSMEGLGVPSKTYNLLAAGKPILYLGSKNSEIGQMVNENEIGWQFELSDVEGLLKFFNEFTDISLENKGINARYIAENKYSKDIILQKFVEIL